MTKSAHAPLLIVTVILATFFLAACSATSQPATSTSTSTQQTQPAADAKKGDTTKTGKITKAGDSYFIQEPGQTPAAVDSYAIDLAQYEGKTVKVTGQYSGDILFIGKVE